MKKPFRVEGFLSVNKAVADHAATHFVKNVAVHIIFFQISLQGGAFFQCLQILRRICQTEDKIKYVIACSRLGHRQEPTAEQRKIALLREHFRKGQIP